MRPRFADDGAVCNCDYGACINIPDAHKNSAHFPQGKCALLFGVAMLRCRGGACSARWRVVNRRHGKNAAHCSEICTKCTVIYCAFCLVFAVDKRVKACSIDKGKCAWYYYFAVNNDEKMEVGDLMV